ncbi:DnaJ subfamily C member 17 [Choanephora cucurbitarum]|uniref:DnaJ subfamily C member 17 n=1 Tax=Choanephora cucurbitarum TaxID=101091 RepID=A0A1C7N6K2_9FUNG|nr:DnaJ subfamily C member 17 [Choanephora cucurbitarum]
METEVDYYELLGLEITASADDIKKAYRKRALKVHPDKNPSPDAAVLFHNLTQAQDLLLNPTKRSEYDQRHRARQERTKKKKEMDSKRREAQDELERREREAKRVKTDQNQAKAQYEAELARLREEGAKRRQEDWVTEPKETETELPPETERDCALKFKWSSKHRLTENELHELLSTVANVDTVAFSQKKKRSALAIFKTVVDAYTVITKKDSHPSLSKFDLIDWAAKKPPPLVEKMMREEEIRKQARAALFAVDNRSSRPRSDKPLFSSGTDTSFKAFHLPALKNTTTSKLSDNDYESLTLMKMRQAEKNRLIMIGQMKQESASN